MYKNGGGAGMAGGAEGARGTGGPKRVGPRKVTLFTLRPILRFDTVASSSSQESVPARSHAHILNRLVAFCNVVAR